MGLLLEISAAESNGRPQPFLPTHLMRKLDEQKTNETHERNNHAPADQGDTRIPLVTAETPASVLPL